MIMIILKLHRLNGIFVVMIKDSRWSLQANQDKRMCAHIPGMSMSAHISTYTHFNKCVESRGKED